MIILWLIGLLGKGIGFLFFTYSLATGLYYLSELVEEYSVLAKRVISYTIVTVIMLHIGLLIEGHLPGLRVLFSMICTIWYSRLLVQFPMLDMTGPIFIVSCLLCILNHLQWFFYFKVRYLVFGELVSFFALLVWMVPFLFMLSLSANDLTLPTIQGSSWFKFSE